MTNYNERLDEIVRNAYSGEVSWIHDQFDDTSVLKEVLGGVEKEILNTKQAHTSLIKELVAEAKPTTMPSNLSPENYEKCERVVNQFEQNLLKELEEV